MEYTIDPESGCWLWNGTTDRDGYGRTVKNGRQRMAHRAVFEDVIGPIPSGYNLHHECRNPRCVNPDHLKPLAPAEHTRLHQPERGSCKLNEGDIREIRSLFASGWAKKALARHFGVDPANIRAILRGDAWAHVA